MEKEYTTKSSATRAIARFVEQNQRFIDAWDADSTPRINGVWLCAQRCAHNRFFVNFPDLQGRE